MTSRAQSVSNGTTAGFIQHHFSELIIIFLSKIKKSGAGFTLIELIIILTIIPILTLVTLNLFNDYRANSELILTSEEMRQAFAEARTKAMIGENADFYGVNVNTGTGTFTIFQGESYATRVIASDRVHTWHPTIVTYAGPAEVRFSKIKGTTTPATITLSNVLNKQQIISINDVGAIQ